MDIASPTPRDHAQAYALTFPGAYVEHPWGETVVKVSKKVFLFVNGAIAPEDEGMRAKRRGPKTLHRRAPGQTTH